MRDSSLYGHTIIAAALVATAYVAWMHPTITDKDDQAVILAGDKDALTAVIWEDSDNRVSVARTAGESGACEVSVTKLQPPTPPETYPGSEAAKQLLDTIAPLKAARNLGPMDANARQAFGLDAPKTRLTLQFADRQAKVDVGSTTFGSGDYYVEGPDHHAYLMRAQTVSSLGHGAVRLQDRDVVGVPRGQFNRLVVTQKNRSKVFLQRHPENPAEAFFAEAAEPDRKLENLTPWVDRLLRLRVVNFANATPGEEPAVSIALFLDKTQKTTLRLWPGSDQGSVIETPRFKQPVLVSKQAAEGVLHDLDAILSEGSEPPAVNPLQPAK